MKRLRLSFLLLCCIGLLTGCGKDAKKDAEKESEQVEAKDKVPVKDKEAATDKGKSTVSGQNTPNTASNGAYGYLPKNTVVVAFIRPKQMIESEFVGDLKIADMQEEMQQGLPFPANQMDELAMFIVKPDKLPPLPAPGPAFPPDKIESSPFPPPELKPQEGTQPPENSSTPPGLNPECDEQPPVAEPMPTENETLENPMVVRVRLTQTYSETDFLNRWSGEIQSDFQERTAEPQTYNGKKYLQIQEYFLMQDFSKINPQDPNQDFSKLPKKRQLMSTQALYQGEPNTWYIGSEANVKQVIDGQGGSPIVKELAKIPTGMDMGIAATLEGQQELRDFIKKGIEASGSLEQVPVEGLNTLPDDLLAINGWFHHNANKGDALLQINLVGVNPTAAANIQKSTQNGMQMLQGLVGFLQFGNKDPKTAPMIQKLATLVNSISVTQDGATVAVKLPHPGGLKQLALELQPAIAQAREQQKLTKYRNNLKQIGLALHNAHDTFNGFFLDAQSGQPDTFNADGTPKYSWRAFILPYLDQAALSQQYKMTEAWDSDANKALVNSMPETYQTPGIDEPGKTGWRIFVGNGDGASPAVVKGKKSLIADFVDGTSNTILAVQVGPDKATLWTDPIELAFDPKNPAANKEALGKLPGPTFMVLFADGSVKDLPVTISPELLTALLTRNGNEEITPELLEKGGVDPSLFLGPAIPGLDGSTKATELQPPSTTTTEPAQPEPQPENTTPKPEEKKPE